MSIAPFLQFNNICPICKSKLDLYLDISNFSIFKAVNINTNDIVFEPYDYCYSDTDDQYIILNNNQFQFSSNKIETKTKENSFFFYFRCGSPSVNECYTRSSPMMELDNNSLKMINPDHINIPNVSEAFNFYEGERQYVLILDTEMNNCIFCFCYDKTSNMLLKEMPLMPRPNFDIENRSNLIDKFNTWIIFD